MTVSKRAALPRLEGYTHHGRLRRKELQREVIGAIRQCIDLIRNLLHCEIVAGGKVGGRGVEGAEALWPVIVSRKLSAAEGTAGGGVWGICQSLYHITGNWLPDRDTTAPEW